MSELWQWAHDDLERFRAEDDQPRIEMANLMWDTDQKADQDPLGQLEAFRRCSDLAKHLDEPWWKYLSDVRIAICYEYRFGDIEKGLHQSVFCVSEGRKQSLKGHPWRIPATNTLLACYLRIDPYGYSEVIRTCLRELDKEIPLRPCEDRFVMLKYECDFSIAVGDLVHAEKTALSSIGLYSNWRQPSAWYGLLAVLPMCWLSYHKRSFEQVMAYSLQAEQMARSGKHFFKIAESQVWQAIVARVGGKESEAKRLVRSALNRTRDLMSRPTSEYCDALAYFHELGGDLCGALKVRDMQIEGVVGKGCHGYECAVQLKRCELLGLMGKLGEPDLVKVREKISMLKDPSHYLSLLEQVGKFLQ